MLLLHISLRHMFCLLPWLCVEKATVTYSGLGMFELWINVTDPRAELSECLWHARDKNWWSPASLLLAWVSWNPLTEKISSPTRPGTLSGRITKCKNPDPIWPISFHLWEHLHRPKGKIVSKCFLLTNIVFNAPNTRSLQVYTPKKTRIQ